MFAKLTMIIALCTVMGSLKGYGANMTWMVTISDLRPESLRNMMSRCSCSQNEPFVYYWQICQMGRFAAIYNSRR